MVSGYCEGPRSLSEICSGSQDSVQIRVTRPLQGRRHRSTRAKESPTYERGSALRARRPAPTRAMAHGRTGSLREASAPPAQCIGARRRRRTSPPRRRKMRHLQWHTTVSEDKARSGSTTTPGAGNTPTAGGQLYRGPSWGRRLGPEQSVWARWWPMLANLGQSLMKLDQTGQLGPKFSRCWPRLTEVRQMSTKTSLGYNLASVDQNVAKSAKLGLCLHKCFDWPTATKVWPTSATFGRSSPNFGQTCPSPATCWSNSAEFGRIWAGSRLPEQRFDNCRACHKRKTHNSALTTFV